MSGTYALNEHKDIYIVAGFLVFLALIVVICIVMRQRRARRQEQQIYEGGVDNAIMNEILSS